MVKNSTWAYVNKFFELRPAFLADAAAHKVGVGNIKDWVKENAPDYESVSKEFGFDSIDDEINFAKELADLLKEDGSINGYIRTLRRNVDPSSGTKTCFINALGKTINKLVESGKFSSEKNLAYAKNIGKRFAEYDGLEQMIEEIKAEQKRKQEEQVKIIL